MDKFTPKHIPEMVIEYTIMHSSPPSIWINDILVNGDYVSAYLFNILIKQHRPEWVREIRESLSVKI